MVKRYLGYGYTNNQGVAKLEYDANGDALTHSYTGVGAGSLQIVAEVDDGAISSDEYTITDCSYYDRGSSSKHKTYSSTTSSLDYTSDYTILTEATEGTDAILYFGAFDLDYRVEMDVCVVDGSTDKNIIRFVNPNSTSNIAQLKCSHLDLTIGEWSHIVFDVKEGGVYVDDSRKSGLPSGVSDSVRVGLWCHSTITTAYFKNVEIYPI